MQQPLISQGLLRIEVSWSHSGTLTIGRTPLDGSSARRRDLYLTTHNNHKRQTSMFPVGFEPAFPTSERPQTHALDRTATGIGQNYLHFPNFETKTASLCTSTNNQQRPSHWVYSRWWTSFGSAIVASLLFNMKSMPCLNTFRMKTSAINEAETLRQYSLAFWRIALQ